MLCFSKEFCNGTCELFNIALKAIFSCTHVARKLKTVFISDCPNVDIFVNFGLDCSFYNWLKFKSNHLPGFKIIFSEKVC